MAQLIRQSLEADRLREVEEMDDDDDDDNDGDTDESEEPTVVKEERRIRVCHYLFGETYVM